MIRCISTARYTWYSEYIIVTWYSEYIIFTFGLIAASANDIFDRIQKYLNLY
jgi:hypothetical protein